MRTAFCMGDALRPAIGWFSKGSSLMAGLGRQPATGTWVGVGAVRASLVDAMQGLIRDAVIAGENNSRLGASDTI